jgi:hypothetical protein
MTNTPAIFLVLIVGFLTFLPASSYSQFINLQIRVEPELSATVEQELNFGEVVTNSGEKIVGLGDFNMGVFNIRGYHTQNIYIQLNYPEALNHINPAIGESIPLDLDIAYNNSGRNIAENSDLLPTEQGFVAIHENPELDTEVWQSLYLYVYGSIFVGNIPNGEYFGEVTLSVSYD